MFEWDPHKAFTNELKHGITFEEASTVFADTSSLTIYDELHSDTEERFIVLGRWSEQRLLVVVHTDRQEVVRIISARRANSEEHETYEQRANPISWPWYARSLRF